MKIISFVAENVKRLRAIQIDPENQPVVQVTGRNGQGKTSALDALWWALTGLKNVQDEPIRKGAHTAKSSLAIGGTAVEFVVTRSWRKNENDETISSISVETAQGSAVRSPQSFLDSLIGSLALDPLEFARNDDKKQFDTLKRFVTDYDFEMKALERKKLFDDRTAINRRVSEARVLVDKIVIGPEYAIVKVDEAAILEKLRTIAETNELTSKKAVNRGKLSAECAAKRTRCKAIADEIVTLLAKIATLEAESILLTGEADAGEKRLADAPALPELLKTDDIMKELDDAKTANKQVALREEKATYDDSYKDIQSQSLALDTAIAALDTEKSTAISKASFPIPGLSIGDGVVLYNGVPFKQASDAEQLRVSIAIAMSSNPKLRVIRVRDGSLLDADSMKVLESMAIDSDYQVWIERVDSSGVIGFVIEDGQLVSHVPSDARPVTPASTTVPPAPRPQPKPAAVKPTTPAAKPSFHDDVI